MVALLKLATAVHPTTCFQHPRPELANSLVADIGIRQQIAFVAREKSLWPNAATVGCIEKTIVRMLRIADALVNFDYYRCEKTKLLRELIEKSVERGVQFLRRIVISICNLTTDLSNAIDPDFAAGWDLVAEIDQQITRFDVVILTADRYGRQWFGSAPSEELMRYEAAVPKRPQ